MELFNQTVHNMSNILGPKINGDTTDPIEPEDWEIDDHEKENGKFSDSANGFMFDSYLNSNNTKFGNDDSMRDEKILTEFLQNS